jgi:hypothetical protein
VLCPTEGLAINISQQLCSTVFFAVSLIPIGVIGLYRHAQRCGM